MYLQVLGSVWARRVTSTTRAEARTRCASLGGAAAARTSASTTSQDVVVRDSRKAFVFLCVTHACDGLRCAVLLGGLNNPCLESGGCLDRNAECNGVKCICKASHFERAGICGWQYFIDSLRKLVILYNLIDLSSSAAKIPLNSACTRDDVCADVSAQCRNGRCSCAEEFYDKNGVCCE